MSGISQKVAAEWYLFARRGDIAARVSDGLLVGEDPDGDIRLNPNAEQAQLAFTLNPNGSLALRVLDASLKMQFSDGVRSGELQIESTDSVRLRLPHHEIFIHTGLIAVAPDTPEIEVDLIETSPRSLLLLDEAPILLPETLPVSADQETTSPESRVALVVIITLLALVLALLPTSIGRKAVPAQVSGQTEPVPALTTEPGKTVTAGPAEPTAARAEPARLPVEPEVPHVSPATETPGNSGPTAEENTEVADMLAQARRLIAAGAIVAPSDNSAVGVLTRALRIDPRNQSALDLMWECAETLLSQALTAEAAGREFEARNLLEEILAFHPEHPKANALWTEWVGSPYVRNSAPG